MHFALKGCHVDGATPNTQRKFRNHTTLPKTEIRHRRHTTATIHFNRLNHYTRAHARRHVCSHFTNGVMLSGLNSERPRRTLCTRHHGHCTTCVVLVSPEIAAGSRLTKHKTAAMCTTHRHRQTYSSCAGGAFSHQSTSVNICFWK